VPYATGYIINNTNTIDTFYIDHGATPNTESQKYFVRAKDSCGNLSANSYIAQSIYLKAVNQNFNEYALLEYTPYETWKHGVLSYRVEYYNKSSGNWELLSNAPSNLLVNHAVLTPPDQNNTTNAEICYRVVAIENMGNTQQSISNEACVPVYPSVFLPTAFSPNGDGLNDYYKPICAGFNVYVFEIYNRWGELVYTDTPESRGWDGKFKGENAMPGVYIYRLAGIGILNSPATNPARVIERQGTLTLIK
jgi:gliding motility-associated-like protein